jgi:hypothetical protein
MPDDEFRIEFSGLTADEWPRILDAVNKIGSFGYRVLQSGEFVTGGTPQQARRQQPTEKPGSESD